jgi:DNA polymerase-3 subunit epsilon
MTLTLCEKMKDADWLIVDTETTGLFDPIYVIEVAAQRMHGWEPVGDPFHAYINHGVPVPPEATAVNGITTQFLRKNGRDPGDVHSELSAYFRGLPVVAHNLNFDWDRCLVPEWTRMSMPIPGSKGFCSMLLSRRVFPETKSVKLDTLRELFQIDATGAHSAIGDVGAVVTLLHDVVRPRLEGAGLHTFEEVTAFSRATPIKKCHARLTQPQTTATPPPLPEQKEPTDEWYVLDGDNNVHGPFPADQVRELAAGAPCYIWRDGIPDWTISSDDPWFEKLASRRLEVARPKYTEDKNMAELIGLCRGVIADEKVTNKEVYLLSQWLEDCPFLDTWPASEIAQEVEQILDDGVITKEEKERLGKLLVDITNA